MVFSTTQEALDWFTSEERVITPKFLADIPWSTIADYPIDPQFVPVLTYMRDIETYTNVYYSDLCKSPTGKDPHVRAFMDRWSTEEPMHGELLNRFLEEAGIKSPKYWKQDILRAIPAVYSASTIIQKFVTSAFGSHFAAVHMTIGAINEQTTLIGYRRLWELAKHPVLEQILRGIVREEARHAFFYWSVARIKMLNSPFRKKLSRYMVEKFWVPVGEGARPRVDTDEIIGTLFDGQEGLDIIRTLVNDRIAQLPGMEGLTRITDRVAEVSLASRA